MYKNILELLKAYGYTTETTNGSQHLFNCWYHIDNKPSMSVNSEKNVYYCFSCGAKGNIHTLAKEFNCENKLDISQYEKENIFDIYEKEQNKLKISNLAVTKFLKDNERNIRKLQIDDNKEITYFKHKRIPHNVDYNSFLNPVASNFFYNRYDIYYNNLIVLANSLIVVNKERTLLQIINPHNYKSKKFLKYSTLKGSFLKAGYNNINTTIYSEGVSNHLAMIYMNTQTKLRVTSVCCFSSNNLEYILKNINFKEVDVKDVIVAIDNDPAGLKVMEVAKDLGISKFIYENNDIKGYDLFDMFKEDINKFYKNILGMID